MDLLLEHLGKGIYYIILLSMPIVLTAAGIGLIVGILQAVTQVQEQTIAAAPKILGVFLVILLGGTLIMKILDDYTVDAINLAFEVIPKDGEFVIPPKQFESPKDKAKQFFNDKKFVRKKDKPSFLEMIQKPADTPFLSTETPKQPEVLSPAPPLAEPSISEEVQNYKNSEKSSKGIRSIPPIQQKAPTIPPVSKHKPNTKISLLPDLDEPPAVTPPNLYTAPKIAVNNSGMTGAAANITSDDAKMNYSNKKTSTIIINDNNSSAKSTKKSKGRGSIILESE